MRQNNEATIALTGEVSNRAFDEDGSTYLRLDLTLVRTVILGDRWEGDVSISGNSVRIVTDASRVETSLAGRRVRLKLSPSWSNPFYLSS